MLVERRSSAVGCINGRRPAEVEEWSMSGVELSASSTFRRRTTSSREVQRRHASLHASPPPPAGSADGRTLPSSLNRKGRDRRASRSPATAVLESVETAALESVCGVSRAGAVTTPRSRQKIRPLSNTSRIGGFSRSESVRRSAPAVTLTTEPRSMRTRSADGRTPPSSRATSALSGACKSHPATCRQRKRSSCSRASPASVSKLRRRVSGT
mmetsp:Transcript_24647/g.80589  ORF Transcript_24647/g.80589 Transcript_24647/m.80589 type:complete len:212 (+) Transcript_24647:719-1354(+)